MQQRMQKHHLFHSATRWLVTLAATVTMLTAAAHQPAFPYPALPDSIHGDGQRLAWLMEHFWSSYDFADTTVVNRQMAEQGFVDYCYYFPLLLTDSITTRRCAQAFADSITADTLREEFFTDLAQQYLGSPRSPVYDEGVYAAILRALPPTPQRTFLIRQLSLNAVGSAATNFIFTDSLRQTHHLYELSARHILVVFYDPFCDHCRETLPLLRTLPELQRPADELLILTLDVSDTPPALPVGELVNGTLPTPKPLGADKPISIPLLTPHTYYFPEYPALYLLDADKRVILKNTTLDKITTFFTANNP